MNTTKRLTGIAIATAAAAMFVIAPLPATAAEKTVKCFGVNACKGLSSCKTASSSCKGLNSCKGKGFVDVKKSVCKQLGGKVG